MGLKATRTVTLHDSEGKAAYELNLLVVDGASTVSILAKQFKLHAVQVPEGEFLDGIKQLLGTIRPAELEV